MRVVASCRNSLATGDNPASGPFGGSPVRAQVGEPKKVVELKRRLRKVFFFDVPAAGRPRDRHGKVRMSAWVPRGAGGLEGLADEFPPEIWEWTRARFFRSLLAIRLEAKC